MIHPYGYRWLLTFWTLAAVIAVIKLIETLA